MHVGYSISLRFFHQMFKNILFFNMFFLTGIFPLPFMGRSPLFHLFFTPHEADRDVAGYRGLNEEDKILLIMDRECQSGGIERSCSTYGASEVYLPDSSEIYQVVAIHSSTFWRIFDYDPFRPCRDDTVEKIHLTRRFCDKILPELYSSITSFLCCKYEYIELKVAGDDTKMPTFFVRSDGSVLNSECFSIRGQVKEILRM